MSGQHHRTPSTNLHCTARGRPTSSAAVVLLRGLYRPDRLRLCFKACAGRIVRRLCSPAAALFCRLCLPATCAMPCPLPLFTSPVQFCFAPTCSCHVRQDRRFRASSLLGPAVCQQRTVPLAAATRACSGGPCTGPFADTLPFFLQSP